MDSGDDHRTVKKNGHDNLQDKAIRDLHDDFREHIANEEVHHHAVERTMDSVVARIDKYVFAGRITWTFLGILATVVLFYQAAITARLDDLEFRVDELTAKQHAFEERGTKWGEQLDTAVQEIRQDIREIRRSLSGARKE